jgi:hypothetical protein
LPRTSVPSCLTSGLLEAIAPLIIRELAILEGVTRIEEGFDARFILVQIDGIDLRVVQQEVVVHVQLVEHPAQGILADGQDAGIKPCEGKTHLSHHKV